MAKDTGTTTTSADNGGMVTVLIGDAAALGPDTLASVAETLGLTDHGNSAKATGAVVAVAISDGSQDGIALADTEVWFPDGADKVHIKTATITGEQDGTSYQISVLTFKAMDHANKDGDIDIKIQDKSDHGNQKYDIADLTFHIDGNIATATFDAHASADNSLVAVDAVVLTTDVLSLATVGITAAVG
jgi:hypothetical protein